MSNGKISVVDSKLIDCDVSPLCPRGWIVIEHKKDGLIKFDLSLRKGWPVLNASVLDYLLYNPELIPEERKGKANPFWGTIYYHCSDGRLGVRCLYWDGSKWRGGLALVKRWFLFLRLAYLRQSGFTPF